MRHTKLFFVLVLLLLVNSVFAGRYYDAATGRWLQVDPLADNYPSWSPYNYTLNNPIKNVDPDGKAVETALDIISVGISAYDMYQNPSWENAGWLLADVAGAVLPFVPAAGLVRHAGKIDDVVDLVKGADKANDIRKNYKRGKQGEKIVTEVLQKEFGESKKVLTQVTGKFEDGGKMVFDDVVIDKKTGKVILVNETKTGKASYSKAQRRYYKNGEQVTLTGKKAQEARGRTISPSNTTSRTSRVDLDKKIIEQD